jgi:hypothetical protein
MPRFLIIPAILFAILIAYAVVHMTLVEAGQEVIVLRTQTAEGEWIETRLWIIDYQGSPWLHGGDSRWVRNLQVNPTVEVIRGDQTARFRAHPIPGPHSEIHELLRAKYGVAETWVRMVAPDGDAGMPIRLESIDPS